MRTHRKRLAWPWPEHRAQPAPACFSRLRPLESYPAGASGFRRWPGGRQCANPWFRPPAPRRGEREAVRHSGKSCSCEFSLLPFDYRMGFCDSVAAGASPGCQTTSRSREPANIASTKLVGLPRACKTIPNMATDSAVANRRRCPANHRLRTVERCVSGTNGLGARRNARCPTNPNKAVAIAQQTMHHCTVALTPCGAG